MVVPWVGFPLGDLLKRFEPNSDAKYVRFKTLYDPQRMPGQRRAVLRWPYVEGLTIAEAMHPLTLMAVGVYGKELPNQNGAPLRLVIPWKYGSKASSPLSRSSLPGGNPIPPGKWPRRMNTASTPT
jgi:sulfoxide reductase catalytic subunit YedY